MADDRSGADDRARAQGFLPRVPATSGQAKPPHRNLLDRQDGRNLEIQDLLYRPDRDKPSVVPAQAVPDRPSWPPRDHRRNQDVPAEPPIKWQSPMIGPVRISRELGIQTHPILGRRRGHSGIDIVAPIGTYLYAAGRGTVERLANDTRMENGKTVGYGNYIIIRHDDGRRSLYAHLSEYGPWKVGDRLTDDDAAHVPIGRVGVSGGVTGPHLHFEMWDEEDWNKRNPYDPRKVIPQLAEQDRRWRLDEARRAGNEPRQTLPHFGGPR
jgi:murein DD-endopeptidase MepM/ murein hydrolase activator NlpD